MSFVEHIVSKADQQFDQLHAKSPDDVTSFERRDDGTPTSVEEQYLRSNLFNLHDAIHQLSLSSQSRATLKNAGSLKDALGRVKLVSRANREAVASTHAATYDGQRDKYPALTEQEKLEWIVLGKVTTRAYGLVLENLLREIVPLESEITYWRDILSSYRYTSLYSIQTSPLCLWQWSQEVWRDVRVHETSLQKAWSQFYSRVRSSVSRKSFREVRSTVSMPIISIRKDLERKKDNLEALKRQYAASIGFLLGQSFEISNPSDTSALSKPDLIKETREMVVRYLSIMDTSITTTIQASDSQTDSQQDLLSNFSESSSNITPESARSNDVFVRLQSILQQRLPEQTTHLQSVKLRNGKPSRIVRWWLPTAALLLSSSTILKIILNRKADITEWIRDLGSTALDFYLNWVVEPAHRLVGTIRHDEDSEVSIMSKQSLEGDRASLERMVIDFAVQHPEGARLTENDITDLQTKVKAGDLTPVLKAYEKELQSPIWKSIRGNLIRTLLIQVQKTKVDVEVAMGGIDALLKSQELLFSFIGLTPGLLVLVGAYRWLKGILSNRQGLQHGKVQRQSTRLFRNINRILTSPTSVENKELLDYETFGSLVCEAVVLRELAAKALPKQVFVEFSQDFDNLIDLQSGVSRQIRVSDRMRWAYAQWLL